MSDEAGKVGEVARETAVGDHAAPVAGAVAAPVTGAVAAPVTGAVQASAPQNLIEILESITDAFYAVDADWRLTYVNRSAEAMWGLSREKMLGTVLWSHFPGYSQTEGYGKLLQAMQTRTQGQFETYSALLNMWVDVSMYPTSNGGLVVYFRDVTRRKRSEEALQQLNERLEDRVAARTAQVRRLASELIASEQSVRHRIAQSLHDEVQQMIYAIQMQLQILRGEVKQKEPLDELAEMISGVMRHMRQLTVELSPPLLKGEGLYEALVWLAEQMEETHGLQVVLSADEQPVESTHEQRIQLFQLVRELLFNVVKHAEVQEARVTLRAAHDGITVTVCDAGSGFDVGAALAQKGGFGLRGAHERLALFGGWAKISSEPGVGTEVRLFLPYARPSEG